MVIFYNVQLLPKYPVDLSNEAIESSIASITYARMRRCDSHRTTALHINDGEIMMSTSAQYAASRDAESCGNSFVANEAQVLLAVDR